MIELAAPCYDAWITPETESFAAHDLLNDVNSSRGGRTERYDEQSRLNHSTYYSLISLAAVRNLWSVSFSFIQKARLLDAEASTSCTKPY